MSRIFALLAGVAVAPVAVAAVRRRRTVATVAPELRTATTWVPLYVNNKALLWAGRTLMARETGTMPGVRLDRRMAPGGQEVFIYEPAGRVEPGPALLWIHGGGFVMGSPEGDHEFCSRIASELGILVVSARYRLAPESPFPAALDDCFAALSLMHDETVALGICVDRIAVGGSSAGGGLAASLAQLAHDKGLGVAFQLLVYPMLDDRTVGLGPDGRGRLGWTPRSNVYAWSSYLGHRAGTVAPPEYAVAARREDLTGLPAAWVGVGDLDLFFAEDLTYVDRLVDAGVECEVHVEPGMPHGADILLAATVPSMGAFQQRMLTALRGGLGVTP